MTSFDLVNVIIIAITQHMYGFIIVGGIQYSSSTYGQGSGPIFLGYMYCSGSEDSLLKCRRSVFNVVNGGCTNHYYDVGLKCERKFLLRHYNDYNLLQLYVSMVV